MRFHTLLRSTALSVALLLSGQFAAADAVQLSNGDTLHGKVVSLSESQITIESDVLGRINLPRERVAVIALGEAAKIPAASADARAADTTASPALPADAGTAADALKQLQQQGVSREQMNQLRKEMPLLMMPEAKGYFDQTVSGLMSGAIDLGHVRKDAIKARDELELLKKDLGPNGYMLNGYLSILNNFINETEPPASDKSSDAGVDGASGKVEAEGH